MTHQKADDVSPIPENPLEDPNFRWATVESEPAIFDQLLRKIGVRGISVEEVYSLDEDSLNHIKPIHGFIFLFRWKEEPDVNAPEFTCPEDIWFANQVIDNACASLALLNIVLNIRDADIGEHLTAFKQFTQDFTPPLRGITMTNFDYLRRLHNTFARKSEMAESDLGLMHSMKSKGRKYIEEGETEEDCFHFIAYIYKLGHLWELDGLKKAPIRLDKCNSDNWTSFAAPQIIERMERYAADEIRFNLLALCKDNTEEEKSRLEEKAEELALEQSEEDPDHRVIDSLKSEIRSLEEHLHERQVKLASYSDYAERRRHDYVDFSKRMLEILNRKGVLKQVWG